MGQFAVQVSRVVTAAAVFITAHWPLCLLINVILFSIGALLWKVGYLQRLIPYIWRSLQEEPEDAEEDDENWFGNLNPEQSVELHRRQRFEAAAGVMENVAGEKPTKEPPLRRRETYG